MSATKPEYSSICAEVLGLKRRVVATVSAVFYLELERVHDLEIARARIGDREEPCWSNTVEMLLRKGVKAYKSAASFEK